MKRVFVRTLLLLAVLPVIVWAFVSELCRGVAHAFRDASIEVRLEIGCFPSLWREAGDL